MKCLSRKDIEAIAARVLKAYKKLPEVAGKDILRIDPELLLTRLLGLKIEYARLSLDGSVLGATTTSEADIEVYSYDDEELCFSLDGKTVLIEQELKENCTMRGRCNFTIAHEGSHQILKMLFPNDYDKATPAAIHFYKANSEKNQPISDWYEWQANALASAILLPFELIDKGMYYMGITGKIDYLNKMYRPDEYNRFCNLADFLGVSKTALAIRMKQLGLIGENQLDNPRKLLEVEYKGV